MLFLSISLCLYILSSASIITSLISWFIFSFVAVPKDMLIGILCSLVRIHTFFILFIISSASSFLVLGSRIVNSSPPHLAMTSSFLQNAFNNSAALTISLSPSRWPKASFTSLILFISPIVKLKGSCL